MECWCLDNAFEGTVSDLELVCTVVSCRFGTGTQGKVVQGPSQLTQVYSDGGGLELLRDS